MIVIGIILVLLGLVLGGFVVAGSLPGGTGTEVAFELFGLSVQTSVVVVFALGALTLLLLELGVLALRSGARKSSKRRSELQRLRRVEAEVQARQASDSQRNAATAPAAPAAPAPFARRDADPSTRPSTGTGENPTVPADTTDDTTAYRAVDRSGETGGPSEAAASTRPTGDTGSTSTTTSTTTAATSGTDEPDRTDRA